jgi:transposase-like protein
MIEMVKTPLADTGAPLLGHSIAWRRSSGKEFQARIAALYAEGLSIHQISKQLGIGYGTAWNYVQHAK